VEKWGFSGQEALNAVTTIHANPSYFGKVMAMTKPKHAVAYHFQNDYDTLPIIMNAVEELYNGPVDYAQDFMVWNITKEGVSTRMAVTNPDAYPTPPLKEKRLRRVVVDTKHLTRYLQEGRKKFRKLLKRFIVTSTKSMELIINFS